MNKPSESSRLAPSLIVSFAILHEATAFVPLVGMFFGARALGIGERVVHMVESDPTQLEGSWVRQRCKVWIDEGERWAVRVGKRYEIWGYGKDQDGEVHGQQVSERIVGDVANAVVAYGMTKALMPLRVGLSLYLSPSFARRIVDPCSNIIRRAIRRHPPP